MPDKFKNRYRIASTRLRHWDYSRNGAYFVTICTAQRQHYFGEIINCEMQLSAVGQCADKCWLAIPDHFPHFYLDAFVTMPDHVHGILVIDKPFVNKGFAAAETRHAAETGMPCLCRQGMWTNKQQNSISDFETRVRIQYPPLWVLLRLPLQNIAMKINLHLDGKHVFMIIS